MIKILKKIKSNSFISKAVALLTICMVLMSSLTVSSFAAEEETSAANEDTDSITDVWTSVMNWITSSLGSVQGVFYSSSPVTNGTITLTGAEGAYTADLGFNPSVGDSFTLYFTSFGESVSLDFVFEFDDETSPPILYAGANYGDYIFLVANLPGTSEIGIETSVPYDFSGETFDYTFTSASGGSLTFLGTLAAIGVAIAIAFLLISVISRFLRLRG